MDISVLFLCFESQQELVDSGVMPQLLTFHFACAAKIFFVLFSSLFIPKPTEKVNLALNLKERLLGQHFFQLCFNNKHFETCS